MFLGLSTTSECSCFVSIHIENARSFHNESSPQTERSQALHSPKEDLASCSGSSLVVSRLCIIHALVLELYLCNMQRRYTAPPNQAGLKMTTVLGYNGNGRGNMVWNPDTGELSS